MVAFAANTFPTTLNDWSSGEVIPSDWADSLEEKLGINNSNVITSLDFLLRATSSTDPGHKHSSTTITGLTIGTNVQAWDVQLDTLASFVANRFLWASGTDFSYITTSTAMSFLGGSTSTGANPSASVGLTATNGTANTFMRSDASPALSQSIIPIWTGLHEFTAGASSSEVRTPSSTLGAARATTIDTGLGAYEVATTTATLGVTFDGEGSVIAAGASSSPFRVPVSGTIRSWFGIADKSCSASFDVWKSTGIPTNAGRIAGTDIPNVSSTQYSTSSALTGWATSFSAGDLFMFVATGTLSGCTRVNVGINYSKL